MTAEVLGSVSSLWRYPVKSMLGEQLDRAEVSERGVLGDRAHALIDLADGKVVSAKNPRKWGRLLEFAAAFADRPTAADELPPVDIRFPDGVVRRTSDPGIDDALSRTLGRPVRLASMAPAQPVLEEYWPDIDGLAPSHIIQDSRISPDGAAETISDVAMALAAPPGTFFDLGTIHLITTATLARLRQLYPGGDFDPRRYRPNLLLETPADPPDFIENAWLGRKLHIGDELVLRVNLVVPRCVMTTLAQSELPRDTETLRTIARHNRAEIPGFGFFACAGVYAEVVRPGLVCQGDAVRGE